MARTAGRLPGSVLVTGGLGFIGSNAVDALLSRGCAVTVLDDLSTGDRANLTSKKPGVVIADVADLQAVRKAAREKEAVVHLAAIAGIRGPSPSGRLQKVNVEGTGNLLEACAAAGVKNFVFASSLAVYQDRANDRGGKPVVAPASPYGRSKLEAEALCERFAADQGAACFALRLANVYGPRMRTGSDSSVMAEFATAVARDEPLRILGDGRQTRDFVHVTDVVGAILAALAAGVGGFRVADIGTGRPTAINRLAGMFLESSGKKLPIKHLPAQKEVKASYADTVQARRLLGFRPAVPLRAGVADVLRWSSRRRP
ncbi:MAG: NAD-dependent epimerase/dehydratase family protein [Nitrososphaerota archaeon]|nr:NAD-dependent epimerase/dehydratase family protein [Nitrososphaerota archaeon]